MRQAGRKLVAVGLAAGIALILFSLALAFSNANSAAAIAHNSQLLQWANASSGTAALTRASLNQALVYTVDERAGVASRDARDTAIREAATSVAALSDWVASAPAELARVAGDLDELRMAGSDTIAALEEGRVRLASAVLADAFEPHYEVTAAGLVEAQRRFAAEVNRAESAAGRTERITRFLVTLLIPAAAIALHQIIVRRQYRERRVEMETRLRAQQELNEAKDQLIAGLSHQLRTPLTSIYGFSEYLLDHGIGDPQEVAELIEMINKDSADLSRMVDDLITAARLDAEALAMSPEPTDVKAIASSVAYRLSRNGHDVRISGRGGIAMVDPNRLRQVISNLASNATQHGGPLIDITVDHGLPGDPVTLTVADDGGGVSEDVETRLFERFVHEGKDTLLTGSIGLGLAIVRSLVEAMGGSVAYSREHGWSKFIVSLPPAPEGAVPARTEPPAVRDHEPPRVPAPAIPRPRDEEPVESILVSSRSGQAGPEALVIFGDDA